MESDTVSITALRQKAAALRAQADQIDKVADEVQHLLTSLAMPDGFEATLRSTRKVPIRSGQGGGKGKAPGTMNMTWRQNFARIADVSGRDPFPLSLAQDVLRERLGREVKLSALRRHFNSYLEHGYVTSDGADTYLLTDKLRQLVDGLNEADTAPLNENEASAADAANASETAAQAQNGGPQE